MTLKEFMFGLLLYRKPRLYIVTIKLVYYTRNKKTSVTIRNENNVIIFGNGVRAIAEAVDAVECRFNLKHHKLSGEFKCDYAHATEVF